MGCSGTSDCGCGCCSGAQVATPQPETNKPGLPALAYRMGDYGSFLQSMTARLSSADYPALKDLRSRDGGDFSMALLDASAIALDILTFYQERIANEHYLGTAAEQRSMVELSRLIGYQLASGVAASAYLAFTAQAAAGASTPGPFPVPEGTQVQSVPAPGQKPQTFETTADFSARTDWNAIPVNSQAPWEPKMGDRGVWLAGTSTQLQAGDALLIVGDERNQQASSNRWDLRLAVSVQPDPVNQRTYVAFDRGLGDPAYGVYPSQSNPKVYALRQRAALFGNNAPDANMFDTTNTGLGNFVSQVDGFFEWDDFQIDNNQVDLDSAYPKILPDSWFVLASNETAPSVDLYYEQFANNLRLLFAQSPSFAQMGATLASAVQSIRWSNATIEGANADIQVLAIEEQMNDALQAVIASNPVNIIEGLLTLGASDQVNFSMAIVANLLNYLYMEGDISNISWAATNIDNQLSTIGKTLTPMEDFVQQLSQYYQTLTSQLAAAAASPQKHTGLFKATQVSQLSRSDFGLSGKVTRLAPDTTANYTYFPLRDTTVLAQSEELAVAPQPLAYPLYGATVLLQATGTGLAAGRYLAVSGRAPKLKIQPSATGLTLTHSDDGSTVTLNPGDALALTAAPSLNGSPLSATRAAWSGTGSLEFTVLDLDGREGNFSADWTQVSLVSASPKDPLLQEIVQVGSVSARRDSTTLSLSNPLANCYDPPTVSVNANVAPATQGTTVSEILGNGNALDANQAFTLKQPPLTFVTAATPTGSASTLEVSVNGLTWKEVPSLYQAGPKDRVYVTRAGTDGSTRILFGDGIEGARLPTGQNNVQASYRVGLGSSGNVGTGTLTTLLDRPLGISGVVNPQAAEGGQDAPGLDQLKTNAPLTVMTLDRVVSTADYENFARAFSGIAKANALWIPSGPSKGIFLTVAGTEGAAVDGGSPTFAALYRALKQAGRPGVKVTLDSFLHTLFGLEANLAVDPDVSDPDSVLAQAQSVVEDAYSFDRRSFGQRVAEDEVTALLQAVPGVLAVQVSRLYRLPVLQRRRPESFGVAFGFALEPQVLTPQMPSVSGNLVPAELLTLDPSSLVLGTVNP